MQMIEVKTDELTGAALDWAVAIALGATQDQDDESCLWTREASPISVSIDGHVNGYGFRPSVSWADGGPLWEIHVIGMRYHDGWLVAVKGGDAHGPTKLKAMCRAIVTAKTGDVVKVPAHLVGGGM